MAGNNTGGSLNQPFRGINVTFHFLQGSVSGDLEFGDTGDTVPELIVCEGVSFQPILHTISCKSIYQPADQTFSYNNGMEVTMTGIKKSNQLMKSLKSMPAYGAGKGGGLLSAIALGNPNDKGKPLDNFSMSLVCTSPSDGTVATLDLEDCAFIEFHPQGADGGKKAITEGFKFRASYVQIRA